MTEKTFTFLGTVRRDKQGKFMITIPALSARVNHVVSGQVYSIDMTLSAQTTLDEVEKK